MLSNDEYDLLVKQLDHMDEVQNIFGDEGNIDTESLTNEKVEVLLTKDGEAVEYTLGNAVTEIGEYSLEIIDSLGNTESRNFSIVAPIVREFTHNFDDVPGFEKVLVNGEDKRLNYGTLELFVDGVYEVGVVVNGET